MPRGRGNNRQTTSTRGGKTSFSVDTNCSQGNTTHQSTKSSKDENSNDDHEVIDVDQDEDAEILIDKCSPANQQ
jgi:hypothetical protein